MLGGVHKGLHQVEDLFEKDLRLTPILETHGLYRGEEYLEEVADNGGTLVFLGRGRIVVDDWLACASGALI